MLSLSSWMQPEYVESPLTLAPASSYIHREPYGVVLLIAPFNYPVQLVVQPLLSILAAGNCCVVKPSEMTPATSAALADLLPRYLDPQAVCCVQGAVAESTALLKLSWDFIFFTGSEAVGRIVARAAAEHLTPVMLELGGKSPVIVDETADIPLAARRVAWGKTYNLGQSCIAPDFAFVHREVKAKFMQELTRCLERFYGRDAQQSADLSRIVSSRHAARIKAIIDSHRADVVYGGEADVEARWISPTVLDLQGSTAERPALQQEIFGPVLPVIEYTDLSSVIAYINSRPKPLALYLFSSSSAVQRRVLAETSSGGCGINDVMMQYANKSLPFGGVGSSGIGAYHGRTGFNSLSHSRAVLHKSVYLDAPLRYPPYGESAYRMFSWLISIVRISQPPAAKIWKGLLALLIAAIVAERIALFAGLKKWW
jgi:aldehyde dehydrogenase (NAD+)